MADYQPLTSGSGSGSGDMPEKALDRCMTRVVDLLKHIGFPEDSIDDKAGGICQEVHGIQRGAREYIGLVLLLLASCFLIYFMGYGAYWASYDYEMKQLEPGAEEYTFDDFMLPTGITSYGELFGTSKGWKVIGAGLVGGLVFGFIDNAGLWFGMDALDAFLPGGELMRAGFGNTFSDVLGAFIGTFVAIIVAKKAEMDLEGNPFWINAVGMLFGCLLGVAIPHFTMKFGGMGGSAGKGFLACCAFCTFCTILTSMITIGRAREFDSLAMLNFSGI